MNQSQVIELLKKQQGEKSLRQFAKEIGISAAYLSDVYLLQRKPGPMILKQLGLKRHTETKTIYLSQSESTK